MKKKLEVMKVRPEFKHAFKLAALKNGFGQISDFSEYLAHRLEEDDADFAKALSNKEKEKTWKRYF